jgi:molybdopterin synthase catalytic subunit
VAAVDLEYVGREHVLRPGVEVALIPPVSGGALPPFLVTTEHLDAAAAADLVRRPGHGAIIVFEGVVRDNANGRATSWLEYEAYPELAERLLAEVGAEVAARWGLEAIVIWHRIGRLDVGETSLVVALGTPHRGEAFDAVRYCVDRVKQRVPVWKKEVGPDGSYWVEGSMVEPGPG